MALLGTSANQVEAFNGTIPPKGTRTEVVEVNTPTTGPLILPWILTLSANEEVSIAYEGITISGLPSTSNIKNTSLTDRTYNFTISFGNVKESVTDGSYYLAVRVLNVGEPTGPPSPDQDGIPLPGGPIDTGVDTGTNKGSGGSGTSNEEEEFPERDETIIQ